MSHPIKVAIVGDGAAHIQSREAYREQATDFANSLNRRMTGIGDKEHRAFSAVVVDTVEEALRGHLLTIESPRRLVFISNIFLPKAKELALEHARSNLRVYVITGLPPSSEPVVIEKRWLAHASIADLME